jgi:hypothetical protein
VGSGLVPGPFAMVPGGTSTRPPLDAPVPPAARPSACPSLRLPVPPAVGRRRLALLVALGFSPLMSLVVEGSGDWGA